MNNDFKRLIAAIPDGAENILVIFSERQIADFDCSGSWQFRKPAEQSLHDFFKYIQRQGVGNLQELEFDLDGQTHKLCMNEAIIQYWETFAEAILITRSHCNT